MADERVDTGLDIDLGAMLATGEVVVGEEVQAGIIQEIKGEVECALTNASQNADVLTLPVENMVAARLKRVTEILRVFKVVCDAREYYKVLVGEGFYEIDAGSWAGIQATVEEASNGRNFDNALNALSILRDTFVQLTERFGKGNIIGKMATSERGTARITALTKEGGVSLEGLGMMHGSVVDVAA